jgi:phenylacetate-CoA ligase
MTMSLSALTTKLKRLDVGERLVRRNPLYYSVVQRELAQLEHADATTRNDWMQERLRRILSAAAHTAYGRGLGAPRDIRDWPLLRKESVRNHPDAFVRGSHWGSKLFNAHASTGGTTGVPLRLQRSPESVVAEQVCQDDAIAKLGIDPRNARIAVLRGDDIKSPTDTRPPYWMYALGGKRLILSSNHLSQASFPDFVQALSEFRPDVLWVYPTTLEALCLLVKQTGVHLPVPRVLSSSEMLQPQVWKLAQQLLRCTLADRYGQAERVACAHAFAPEAYRFIPGYAYVELIADSNVEPISDSKEALTRCYEIVGTSLWNTAMPLVRYCTGDLVRLPRAYGARELQEIVLGLRTFEGVIGRINDVLLDALGMRVLAGINQLPRGVDHLMRLQVVQDEPHEVVLRVLPASGFSDTDAAQLLSNARLKIPDSIAIRLEIAKELRRTKSGKTPFVIHGTRVEEGLRRIGLQTAAA